MPKTKTPQRKSFALGGTVITRAAFATLNEADVKLAVNRHMIGDWGEVCAEDKRSNDFAVNNGLRIFSEYKDREGTKFWIITEADRSYTKVMLPEDY